MITRTISLFILFHLLISSSGYSLGADNVNFKDGDSIKILDKGKNYDARFYIFTDINSCGVYQENINTIFNIFNEFNIEFVVFFNSLDNFNTEEKKSEYNWKFKVIGDEFGIYKDYYKIKYFPCIIIATNKGKVLERCKLSGGEFDIVKVKELIKNNIDTNNSITLNSNIKEINRIPIYKNGNKFLSGEFRSIIYNSRSNQYILRNNNKCPLYIIDSLGIIIKTIDQNTNQNFECRMPYFGLSWAYSDSILFLYDMNNKIHPSFQFYDIYNNSLTDSREINVNKNGNRNNSSIENYFITNRNKFALAHYSNVMENFLLKDSDTTIFIYDSSGNFLFAFGSPDDVYRNYKISDRFIENIEFDNEGNIYSIQAFSNILKCWDEIGNLKKKYLLNFGSNFRYVNFDIKHNLSTPEAIDIWNKISMIWALKHDNITGNKLIYYRNLTFPPGVLDFFSDDAIREVYLHIIDKNGKHLTDDDILLPGSCKPFYFNDSYIYCTELDSKHNLEIVIYKFEPK